MNMIDLRKSIDYKAIGQEMYSLIEELFPICRSITGNGVRKTLRRLQRIVPLTIHEVPSGTQVFDWTVPKEWNINDAYVKNTKGEKIIDFQKSNLHVLNYSTPVEKVVSLGELKEHLFTITDHPEWIPYKTSYYKENWGFCLNHKQFLELQDGEYQVFIDSTLENGSLTYGEYYLPGEQEAEVLISTHVCHPSLANDNLSGVALAIMLARHLNETPRRYSYRFLFIPGTIGAITWLSLNEAKTDNIRHGLVITGVGDPGTITYKKSRKGNAEIDLAASHVLKSFGKTYQVLDFHPYGYDERQYCSPGFNLPVGRFSRTPYGEYPEYHTSADNLNFVNPESLAESFSIVWALLQLLGANRVYESLNQKCEPQLGKRGLYDAIGGNTHSKINELAMLWILNLSDGNHTLLDIADRSGIPFHLIQSVASLLHTHGLLRGCV